MFLLDEVIDFSFVESEDRQSSKAKNYRRCTMMRPRHFLLELRRVPR